MDRAGDPEVPCSRQRVDLHIRPPGLFITLPVQGLMVRPTQRDSKLIADLAPERARLRELEVMCIHWGLLADETGQSPNESEMRLASFPRRLLWKSKVTPWAREPVMWVGSPQPKIRWEKRSRTGPVRGRGQLGL